MVYRAAGIQVVYRVKAIQKERIQGCYTLYYTTTVARGSHQDKKEETEKKEESTNTHTHTHK